MEWKLRFSALLAAYLMASRKKFGEAGSSSLEGAIVFPMVFMVIFVLVGILFFFFNQYNILISADYTMRKACYEWYEGKKLYEDILGEAGGEMKLAKAEDLFVDSVEPVFTGSLSSNWGIDNWLFYRELVFEGGFSGFWESKIKESFPFYRGSVFVRNYVYTRELLEDALAYLGEDEASDEEAGGQVVYVVDDNVEEQEYDRIYHIYGDCQYLKRGEIKSLDKSDCRSAGFRCCRICLARKTGMD